MKIIRQQSKNLVRAPLRSVQLSAIRTLSTTRCLLGAPAVKDDSIPSDSEQATGLERQELDALLAGEPDPFGLEADITSGYNGTRDDPVLVPSFFEERIVGCACEENSTSLTWMVLRNGPIQPCVKCGCCFKLVHTPGAAAAAHH